MTSNKICNHEGNGSVQGTIPQTGVFLPENYPTMVQKYTSRRWRLGYMLILGFVLVQSMQNTMGFAVVCMTGASARSQTDDVNRTLYSPNMTSGILGNTSSTEELSKGEFNYSSETQGLLISSVYYAAVLSPMIGIFFSRRIGPKRVIIVSMLVGGVMMTLIPVAARTHVYLAIACRALMGFCVNTVAPVSMEFWLYWAPVQEKAHLVAYSFMGYNIASVLVFSMSGFLCLIPIDNGWPFIFYVFGSMAVLWCIWCQLTVYETPESHPGITDKEMAYIKLKRSNISGIHKSKKIPWKNMVTTKGIWAYWFLQFSHNWNASVLFSYLPLYMATVLKFDIDQNGLLSSLPYITRVLGTVLIGYISSKLLNILSVTHTRKVIQTGGFFGAASMTVALCYLEEGQESLAVAILAMSTPFQASSVNSSGVTPHDMAPEFASVISSVGMTLSVIASMLSPMAVSYIVPERTREQWTYVFYINAGVFVFAAIVFILFGSAELQPWADNSQEVIISKPSTKKIEINNGFVSDFEEITHM